MVRKSLGTGYAAEVRNQVGIATGGGLYAYDHGSGKSLSVANRAGPARAVQSVLEVNGDTVKIAEKAPFAFTSDGRVAFFGGTSAAKQVVTGTTVDEKIYSLLNALSAAGYNPITDSTT